MMAPPNQDGEIKGEREDRREEGEVRERKHSMRDRTKKKKWYNIHLKVYKRKPC